MAMKLADGTAAPESGFQRVTPPTMSSRLWGRDWAADMPWALDGLVVERGTFADALPFMREHFGAIFGTEALQRFFVEEMTSAKRRFCDEMDVLVFKADGVAVGIYTGHPTDWSTYYIRTLAFVDSFRNRGVTPEFIEHVYRALRSVGVDRLEAECSVANRPMLRFFGKQGWIPTGTVATDRWGAMLRFTKYLNDDAERVFRRQYVYAPDSSGGKPSKEERRKP